MFVARGHPRSLAKCSKKRYMICGVATLTRLLRKPRDVFLCKLSCSLVRLTCPHMLSHAPIRDLLTPLPVRTGLPESPLVGFQERSPSAPGVTDDQRALRQNRHQRHSNDLLD